MILECGSPPDRIEAVATLETVLCSLCDMQQTIICIKLQTPMVFCHKISVFVARAIITHAAILIGKKLKNTLMNVQSREKDQHFKLKLVLIPTFQNSSKVVEALPGYLMIASLTSYKK